MPSLRSTRGISIVEATIILLTVSVLASILAPAVATYVDQARVARAREDVKVIGDAINTFIDDNGEHMFLQVGNGTTTAGLPPTRPDSNRVNLLVSDGDIPSLGPAVSTETYWTQAVSTGSPFLVDTISNHLIRNTPAGSSSNRYRNPADVTISTPGGQNIDFARAESSGFNAPFSWRGAYLKSPVSPDPWGNRYAVNVAFLDPRLDAAPLTISGITAGFTTSDYLRLDVFVLCAGADEAVDTKSAQDGAVPGNDDIMFVISSNAK